MAGCSISLGCGDGDYTSAFHSVRRQKARKQHRCCECRRSIEVGTEYEYTSGVGDGFYSIKTCMDCSAIRDAFVDEAYNYGDLWEEMQDHGFENFTHACLQHLPTASAKQFLVDRWLEWKGLKQR